MKKTKVSQKSIWKKIFKEIPYLSDKDNLRIYINHLAKNYKLKGIN